MQEKTCDHKKEGYGDPGEITRQEKIGGGAPRGERRCMDGDDENRRDYAKNINARIGARIHGVSSGDCPPFQSTTIKPSLSCAKIGLSL